MDTINIRNENVFGYYIRSKSAMHRIVKCKGLYIWIGNGEKKKGKRVGRNYKLSQHGQQTEEEEER